MRYIYNLNITNSGFEDGFEGWLVEQHPGVNANLKLDNKNPYSGKNSQLIDVIKTDGEDYKCAEFD